MAGVVGAVRAVGSTMTGWRKSVMLVLCVSNGLGTVAGVSFIVMLMIVHRVNILFFHRNLPSSKN
jgi:hypothetical protein